MLCLSDILTDMSLRFLRCAGAIELSPNWGGPWPSICKKYVFMSAVRWHDTGYGYDEQHMFLRVPPWMERRKLRKR